MVAAAVVRSLEWQGFDRALAEDATQEAGTRYLEGRAAKAEIGTPDQLRQWLYVVARNTAIDHERRAASQRSRLPRPSAPPPPDEVVEHRLTWEAMLARLARMDAQYHGLVRELLGAEGTGRPRTDRDRKNLQRMRDRLADAIKAAVGAVLVATGLRHANRGQRAVAGIAATASVVALSSPFFVAPSGPSRQAAVRTSDTTTARVAPAPESPPAPSASPSPRAVAAAEAVQKRPIPVPWATQPPPGEQRTDLGPPGGAPLVGVGARPNDADKPMLCLRHFPVVGTQCVPKPGNERFPPFGG